MSKNMHVHKRNATMTVLTGHGTYHIAQLLELSNHRYFPSSSHDVFQHIENIDFTETDQFDLIEMALKPDQILLSQMQETNQYP
jgi:hypothetical protein